MKISYIYHSSFVVEEQLKNGHQMVLIFDYFEGKLPEFSPEAYLYVFASHKHGDHFNLCIFDLIKRYRNVTYILGNDIKLNEKYLVRNGVDPAVRECIISAKSHMTIIMKLQSSLRRNIPASGIRYRFSTRRYL